jgi:hypothetical protein
MGATDCFFFGCWSRPGHFLVRQGGRSVGYREEQAIVYFAEVDGEPMHLDGTLAPLLVDGRIRWAAQDPKRLRYKQECPQGHFLLHHLPNGYTAISWWDRTQGDTRGACNSTVLLKGEHDADSMLRAAQQHFPEVLSNLEQAGVRLIQLFPEAR